MGVEKKELYDSDINTLIEQVKTNLSTNSVFLAETVSKKLDEIDLEGLDKKSINEIGLVLKKMSETNEFGSLMKYIGEINTIRSNYLHGEDDAKKESTGLRGILNLDSVAEKLRSTRNEFLISMASKLVGIDLSNISGEIQEKVNKNLEKISKAVDDSNFDIIPGLVGEINLWIEGVNDNEEEIEETQGLIEIEENKKLKVRIEEIQAIELTGEYIGGDWEDFKKLIIDDLEIKDEQEKVQLLTLLETEYRPFYEKLKGNIDLDGVGEVLDSMLDQVLSAPKQPDGKIKIKINEQSKTGKAWALVKGLLSDFNKYAAKKTGISSISGIIEKPLNIGEKEVTFNSKEEAIEIIGSIKTFLKEREDTDIGNVALNLLKFGLKQTVNGIWTLDKLFYQGILEDLKFSTTNGPLVFIPSVLSHTILLIWANNFLKAANSGIDNKNYENLLKAIEENINLYKEAGFEPSEIKNLENLYRNISEYSPSTEGAAIDPIARNRQVYYFLQTFRGTMLMDGIRMGTTTLGNYFDGDLFGKNSIGKTGKTSKTGFIRAVGNLTLTATMFPTKLGIVFINKGVDGRFNGWGIKTKSAVILEYIKAFIRVNTKFKMIFKTIDGMSKFTTDEKKEIKRRILAEYRGDIPTSKNDPLKRWKFNFELLTTGEKEELFRQLETDLRADGIDIKIKTTKDFLLNLSRLKNNKFQNFVRFFKAMNPFENLDRITSEILREEIKNKYGDRYSPDFKPILDALDRNSEEVTKNNIEVTKTREKYEKFIKYYPEITDIIEEVLIEIARIESGTQITSENYEKRLIEIFSDYGINLDKTKINEFISGIDNFGGIETKDYRKNQSNILDILENMKTKGIITEEQYIERTTNITEFYKLNKTLWLPHYIEIIDCLIEGRSYENLKFENIKTKNNNIDYYFREKARKSGFVEAVLISEGEIDTEVSTDLFNIEKAKNIIRNYNERIELLRIYTSIPKTREEFLQTQSDLSNRGFEISEINKPGPENKNDPFQVRNKINIEIERLQGQKTGELFKIFGSIDMIPIEIIEEDIYLKNYIERALKLTEGYSEFEKEIGKTSERLKTREKVELLRYTREISGTIELTKEKLHEKLREIRRVK